MRLTQWQAMACLILATLSSAAYAFDLNELDSAIKKEVAAWSDCGDAASIDYRNIVYVSTLSGFDYSRLRPKVFGGDVKVTAHIKYCNVDDMYAFYVRPSEDGYSIIQYAAYSQPE